MMREDEKYQAYLEILRKELVPAMGCTEPIALAYCAAKARETLGGIPDRILIEASGNIIKNVKSVVVPNTGGGRGIKTAAAIGIIAGDADKKLEVIESVTKEQKKEMERYLQKADFTVVPAVTGHILDIAVTVWKDTSSAKARIVDEHTNLVLLERNGEKLLDLGSQKQEEQNVCGSILTVKDIFDFATIVNIEDVKEILDRQIQYNQAISEEGLQNSYGANIGKLLLKTNDSSLRQRARAKAAAASDARMNGCELPVVINSGSGNQGITASLPVVEYAGAMNCGIEICYRSLVLSNLTAIYLKTGIGRLSAYCGVVSAGIGAGAGIAYMLTGDLGAVSHTIMNALAVGSGMVCDGAKSSCAAKIALAVDAGIMGFEMYQNGQQFCSGEGLVGDDVEDTIRNIGILGSEGMRETDATIIKIMTC